MRRGGVGHLTHVHHKNVWFGRDRMLQNYCKSLASCMQKQIVHSQKTFQDHCKNLKKGHKLFSNNVLCSIMHSEVIESHKMSRLRRVRKSPMDKIVYRSRVETILKKNINQLSKLGKTQQNQFSDIKI